MTITWSINSISYAEPTLIVTVVVSSAVCWLAGSRLARVAKGVPRSWRGLVYLAPLWALTLTAALAGPMFILSVLYPLVYGWNNQVCVAFVLPAFSIPALAAIVAAIRGRSVILRSQNP